MTTPDQDIAESRRLARLIIAVAEQARAEFAAAVRPLGAPVHVARTVLLLGEPRSMRFIAGELACDPSHVTGIADHLEDQGLATRVPGEDRRIKLLKLTPEGQDLRERLTRAVNEKGPFGAQLDRGQKRQLRELLELIAADR